VSVQLKIAMPFPMMAHDGPYVSVCFNLCLAESNGPQDQHRTTPPPSGAQDILRRGGNPSLQVARIPCMHALTVTNPPIPWLRNSSNQRRESHVPSMLCSCHIDAINAMQKLRPGVHDVTLAPILLLTPQHPRHAPRHHSTISLESILKNVLCSTSIATVPCADLYGIRNFRCLKPRLAGY
jgi:hypothetical protein